MMRFGLRAVGAVILSIAVVMSFMLFWFLDTLSSATESSCTCGNTCNMVRFTIPTYFYLGVAGVLLLFVLGVFLTLRGGTLQPEHGGKEHWESRLKGMDADEKAVYKAVMDAGGTIFQSEIVEKLGWSKVKVTRTLDGLESRRLLERRRRGLTNIIVLK